MTNGICITTHRKMAIDRALHITLGAVMGSFFTLIILSVLGLLK